jgi:hypothetical protein
MDVSAIKFSDEVIDGKPYLACPVDDGLTVYLREEKNSNSCVGNEEPPPKGFVKIPNFLTDFLAAEPMLHPEYESLKAHSERYMIENLRVSTQEYRKHIAADFTRFVCITVPDAPAERVRPFVSWCHWVFDFDDQYDEDGRFHQERDQGEAYTGAFMNVLYPNIPDARWDHLLKVYSDVWNSFSKLATDPG